MTHADVHDPAVRRAIEDFVRERFDKVDIVSVDVNEEFTVDDDRVLEITVLFKGTPREIAEQEPPLFLRELRERLGALNETAYPVVGFIPAAV